VLWSRRKTISEARTPPEEGETMNANFNMTMEQYFKSLVEKAGGEFIGLHDGQVCFRGGPNESTCKLYPFALRSTVDVELAIKSARERKKATMWELDSPIAK
jgi:hypothetical protein